MTASLSIGITGPTARQSAFDVAGGASVRVALPATLTPEVLALATRDSELIMAMWKEHPDEMAAIFQEVTAGNMASASRRSRSIGLHEEHFIANGGGLWALVIVIAVAAALLLASDSPMPAGGGGGASDAGVG